MFALLILVLVVAVVVVLAQRSRSEPSSPRTATKARSAPSRGLEADLDRWVSADLLTQEQERAILEHEARATEPAPEEVAVPVAPRRPGSKVPVVAEALGYLGGVLAITGLALVIAHYWPDLALGGRLALAGAGAVALGIGGAVVPEHRDPALTRLKAFLWLLSTAATALFVGVLADGAEAQAQAVVAWSSAAVAVQSGLLWWWRDRPVQQLAALAGLAVAVGTSISLATEDGPAGLALWVLGAGYVTLGLTRRTPVPALTELAGAVTVIAGGAMVVSSWQAAGLLLLVATGEALLVLIATPRLELGLADRLVLGLPAALALLQVLPPTLVYFAREAGVVTGLVTGTVGALLVVAAARGWTRVPVPTEVLGGVALLGGAALVGVQWDVIGPVLGVVVAVGLISLGMLPGRVLLSLVGALGLLVNVPWAIGALFPGEGRAPLLIMVAGVILVAVAVLLTREGDRFRRDLGGTRPRVHRHRPAHHAT